MRKLLLIGQGSILTFMVLAIAACSIGLAAGPLGAVEIKRGAPIEIRALLSGSVVPSVSPLIGTAMELAIKDYGPIHGHHVSVQTLDERCSGPGGRVAAEAVVAEAAVVGVIGTLCSGAAVEASPILSAAGLSMISPANTSPLLTSDLAGNAGPHRHEGYYRVTDNDLIEASVVAHFSYDELGLRRMVTIHDGDAYTSSIANAFAVEFARHGGAVPIVARVAKGQTDMAAVLARFEDAEPDGVFIPLFPSEAASLIRQAGRTRCAGRGDNDRRRRRIDDECPGVAGVGRPLFHGTRSRRQREHEPGDGEERCRRPGRVRGRLWRAANVRILGAWL